MSAEHHGHTKSGMPLTDELIERLADEAEQGYEVEKVLGRRGQRGRPSLGSGPSTVESVRLDPELKERLARRAEADGVPVSDVIREALRHHLDARMFLRAGLGRRRVGNRRGLLVGWCCILMLYVVHSHAGVPHGGAAPSHRRHRSC
jgi:predicted transcriptional regulator